MDGFIPPAIFMKFQALKMLVIALDMRSVEHIFYTPAPDFVHELAGHAPFIVDIDYSEFLQPFGEAGMKSIATREDLELHEAIRKLSILKECPGSTEEAITAAESELQRLADSDSRPLRPHSSPDCIGGPSNTDFSVSQKATASLARACCHPWVRVATVSKIRQ